MLIFNNNQHFNPRTKNHLSKNANAYNMTQNLYI